METTERGLSHEEFATVYWRTGSGRLFRRRVQTLQWSGLPTDEYETLVLIRHGRRAYVRSAAIFRILWCLGLPWKLGAVGWLIPRPVRDWLYDRIARNRYRLFGKYAWRLSGYTRASYPRGW